LVGIVLVSHSAQLARGAAELAAGVAGPEVRIETAGGGPDGSLGTAGDIVEAAIRRADSGQGVVVLGDLGSAFLTIRHVLAHLDGGSDRIRVADAPFVEGAIAAAVTSSTGQPLEAVALAAEEARDANKL